MLKTDVDRRVFIDPAVSTPIGLYRVIKPAVWLRRRARPSAPVDTQLLYGERFAVHHIARGWAYGQVDRSWAGPLALPGYVGYVRASALGTECPPPALQVTALKAPVFKAPDIKSEVTGLLPINALAPMGQSVGDFIQLEPGFIHQRHVAALPLTDAPASYVEAAESFLGLPYIWGGVSSDGLDCSGLVQSALRAVGCDAPRDSDQQAKMGRAVADIKGLRRGDLVFWPGHVGLMQDGERLLHANAYHMKTASEPLTAAIVRIEKSAGPISALRRIME